MNSGGFNFTNVNPKIDQYYLHLHYASIIQNFQVIYDVVISI